MQLYDYKSGVWIKHFTWNDFCFTFLSFWNSKWYLRFPSLNNIIDQIILLIQIFVQHIKMCKNNINNQYWNLFYIFYKFNLQILQTNKGSLLKNLTFWAKDVWNIFDITMYLMFLMSVVLRCLLRSDQFYFARMAYAVTLSMFILRSMHFFFIERFIGPKVVMIGRMVSTYV